MSDMCKQAYDNFLDIVNSEVSSYINVMNYSEIRAAADLILEAQSKGGRIHVSGIGKGGHVAEYIAALLSSTGSPAYFLHGTEAVHGSCGQLDERDVVIFISNSGMTYEMKTAVSAIKNNGCKVIGVSGNRDSWLAGESEVHIYAGVSNEGGPLNRAPRMSVLAEMLSLQALSVVLQQEKDVTPQQYVKWHPGGTLGALRAEEK